jgi:hypothetical protein
METVSFRRRFTHSSSETAINAGEFSNTSLHYNEYDKFGIINATVNGQKQYVKTENFDDGTYTVFTPSVEANPTEDIISATLDTSLRYVNYRFEDTVTTTDIVSQWDIDEFGVILEVTGMRRDGTTNTDFVQGRTSTDGGVTWTSFDYDLGTNAIDWYTPGFVFQRWIAR